MVKDSLRIYTGGYAAREENIRSWTWNGKKLEDCGPAAAVDKASFLLAHPSLPLLYAACETEAGLVRVYRASEDGSLSLLQERASGTHHPCHLAVDKQGTQLGVSGYGGGFSILGMDEDGLLGPGIDPYFPSFDPNAAGRPDRQDASHPHGMVFREDGMWIGCDLGTDRLYLGGRGVSPTELTALAPGSGPRHALIRGSKLFVVNELRCSISVLDLAEESAQQLGEWSLLAFEADGRPRALESEGGPGMHWPDTAAAIFEWEGGIAATVRGRNSLVHVSLDAAGKPMAASVFSLGKDQPRFAMTLPGGEALVAYQAGNHLEILKKSANGELDCLAGSVCQAPTGAAYIQF